MISDAKKEEVRDAADIVEVVSDYVKLKRSGSGFTGLCPYHNEKSPSFHVTPRLGIFKCFGCGESGDVFKFVMDQDGIGFTEAIRQLADRYGVFIPEEDTSEERGEGYQLKEGIYHALKFAGVYFYRNLIENPDADKAMAYLEKRGYNLEVIKRFGLGYSPSGGDDLWKAAKNAGIDEQYLVEADLIKPSNRGEGFYDTFRGRLMFPIFSPTNKVIGFAGRVLGNEKTAKYINSAQTKVYNKSEVVYGVNFAKNEIRKNKEVILVEGYTDVITLNDHGISNVVASSGTALTPGQIRLLKRYGELIIMIYDSDAAGQNAMMRGIDIALKEGMQVKVLELPNGEDPDSFVKQFGRDSFRSLLRNEAFGFIEFLVSRMILTGEFEETGNRNRIINRILESISNIPLKEDMRVYVQALHDHTSKYTLGYDRDLFARLDRILNEKKGITELEKRNSGIQEVGNLNDIKVARNIDSVATAKKPHYEKELIRLMITYGNDMVTFICSLTNDRLFEDDELRMFYNHIVDHFKKGDKITIEFYSGKPDPFPRLMGDVLLERHTTSDRHHEKIGLKYEKDKNPYRTAKSTIKTLELSFFKKKLEELSKKYKTASEEEKRKITQTQADVQSKIGRREKTDSDELYPDPEGTSENIVNEKVFEYKMKGEK